MLTLVPMGGLCNRLRVVLSAIALAHDHEADIHVEWFANTECQAHFTQLFVPIGSGRLHIRRGRMWACPSRRRLLHLPRLLRMAMGYGCQRDDFCPNSTDEVARLMQRHRRVYISSGQKLADYSPECLQRLRPCSDIQQRIDALCRRFAPRTVGVHIRRTDNVQSMAHSPVEAFIEAMRREVRADGKVRFFLATDDAEVKERLTRLFPNRIITQQAPVNRSTLEGMRDAMVDLYCLAATHHLLGSYWSSFTDTAAEIGRIPLTIVGKES